MLFNTLCNLRIYIDADFNNDTSSGVRIYFTYVCRNSNAMLMYFCNLIFLDFVKTSGLSFVSGPRNVLEDRQGRLIL